uniref:Uncharacterized protein n=1 Tax=Panagrolaimus sp. JU765 TaxID=591449 RepID=A0AC34QVM3_9BILA
MEEAEPTVQAQLKKTDKVEKVYLLMSKRHVTDEDGMPDPKVSKTIDMDSTTSSEPIMNYPEEDTNSPSTASSESNATEQENAASSQLQVADDVSNPVKLCSDLYDDIFAGYSNALQVLHKDGKKISFDDVIRFCFIGKESFSMVLKMMKTAKKVVFNDDEIKIITMNDYEFYHPIPNVSKIVGSSSKSMKPTDKLNNFVMKMLEIAVPSVSEIKMNTRN